MTHADTEVRLQNRKQPNPINKCRSIDLLPVYPSLVENLTFCFDALLIPNT